MRFKRSLAFPLIFPCVFRTSEVGNTLSYKLEMGEQYSHASHYTLTTDDDDDGDIRPVAETVSC